MLRLNDVIHQVVRAVKYSQVRPVIQQKLACEESTLYGSNSALEVHIL